VFSRRGCARQLLYHVFWLTVRTLGHSQWTKKITTAVDVFSGVLMEASKIDLLKTSPILRTSRNKLVI